MCATPVSTSMSSRMKCSRVVRKRHRPEELAGGAVVEPHAAAFADRDRDVALDAFRHVRVDPLHVPRIGIDDRADQRLFLVDVHVPVVAGQMLVVPDELARVGVERDRRVAVEIGRRMARDRVDVAAVPVAARVRHRVGDAPVDESPHGVVGAGQPPGRRAPLVDGLAAPGLVAGLAGAGARVEPPRFLARARVVRRDVAVRARRVAGAARDHFAFDDDGAGRVRLDRDRCLPAHGARRGVERDDGVRLAARRRRRVIDHVAVDAERFDARRRRVGRHVLPQRLAGRGVQRDDAAAAVAAARRRQIHDAAMHERNDLELAGRQRLRPRALQRADVVAIDLVERAVTMRVVGAAVHQPVGGIGIAQHGIGDRRCGDAAQQLCAVDTGLSKRGARERRETQRNERNRLARHGRSPEVQTRSGDGIGFATPRPTGSSGAVSAAAARGAGAART